MLGVYIEQRGEYQYFISRLSMIARVNVVLNKTVVVVDSDWLFGVKVATI